MKSPILGSSYVARSVNAADNRLVNLFPEVVPEGGKEPAFLSRAPGLALLATIGTGPIRGMHVIGSYIYLVSGATLYKVDSSWNATSLGTVNNVGALPVSMADDGEILFVACNGPSYTYDTNGATFNANIGTFEQVTDEDFTGAVTVAFLDGYFVYNEPNSQKIWVTSGYDPSLNASLKIDPLDKASVEGSPDNVVGLITDHKELWVFGENSTEVWYDAGTGGFPLAPIQGAFTEIGCASAYSIAKLDNAVFWLGKDARGQGIVYRSRGYGGERISTHAVEWQIQQYGNLSTAVAYTYQQDGHTFYVLTFPTANTTWVYDVATQAWHERAGFVNGQFTRHAGNCQAFFNGVTVIGDYANGNIYKFDLTTYTDNGNPQKWLRSWRALPPDVNTLKRTAHHSLQLDCETGVGLNTGQGIDPQVMLRWSDDGGHTWSPERWTSMGATGSYGTRAIWRRLGMTTKLRDRVYEVSGTDPVKVAILGAILGAELVASQTNA